MEFPHIISSLYRDKDLYRLIAIVINNYHVVSIIDMVLCCSRSSENQM